MNELEANVAPLNLDGFTVLKAQIANFEASSNAIACASISYSLQFQANLARIEQLTHLILAHAKGGLPPSSRRISEWLNKYLKKSQGHLEDPSEDAAVLEVGCSFGSFLILPGLWESAAKGTSMLLQALDAMIVESRIISAARSLLMLSTEAIRRFQLDRWAHADSMPRTNIEVSDSRALQIQSAHLIFSASELDALGIKVETLEPFVLGESDRNLLAKQTLENSALHLKPLIKLSNSRYALVMPTSVSIALRHHVLRELNSAGQLLEIRDVLRSHTTRDLEFSLRSSAGHKIEPVELLAEIVDANTWQHNVVKLGDRTAFHFILLDDPLEEFVHPVALVNDGLEPDEVATLAEQVRLIQNDLRARKIDRSHCILIQGNLGQGLLGFGLEQLPENLQIARLEDIELILLDSSDALNRLARLLEELNRSSARIAPMTGLLELYAYWRQQGFSLLDPRMPIYKTVNLSLSIAFGAEFRISRRKSFDRHHRQKLDGTFESVFRHELHADFDSDQIYGTYLAASCLESNIFQICILYKQKSCWISLRQPYDDGARHTVMELWRGAQPLLVKLFHLLEIAERTDFDIAEIGIDASRVVPYMPAPSHVGEMGLTKHKLLPRARLVLPKNFVGYFAQKGNFGERKMLTWLANAMLCTFAVLCDSDTIYNAVSQVLTPDAKLLHIVAGTPLQALLISSQHAEYRSPKECIAIVNNAAVAWYVSAEEQWPKQLDAKTSGLVLNQSVEHLVNAIRRALNELNREMLIPALLGIYGGQLQDREQWRDTAKALYALHDANELHEVWHRVESERTMITLAVRALLEAAVCECNIVDSVEPTIEIIDDLVARMRVVFDLAFDSTKVKNGHPLDGIEILPSGRYNLNSAVWIKTAEQYVAQLFQDQLQDCASDNDLRPNAPQQISAAEMKQLISAEMEEAFQAEFGLSISEARTLCGAIVDVAISTNTTILTLSRADLRNLGAKHELPESVSENFFSSFTLPIRSSWTPDGAWKAIDIEPWRFERKLSLMRRPLLALNANEAIVSVAVLLSSLAYLLAGIAEGSFKASLFESQVMKSYTGRVADLKGAEFTRRMATVIERLGWSTWTDLKMTQLHAGKTPDLGDVDILAWNSDGVVLVIECKRLKRARNLIEIVEVCTKFLGKVGDRLDKHIKRVTWIKSNLHQIRTVCGLCNEEIKLKEFLLMDKKVPMQFSSHPAIVNQTIMTEEQLEGFLKTMS